jgi:hypothetical protein
MEQNITASSPFATRIHVEDFYPWNVIFHALSKYVWCVPVILGVPGNLISFLVANRPHNRRLSPCIFIMAMAVVDTAVLLEVTWFYALFYPGLLDDLVPYRHHRGVVYK